MKRIEDERREAHQEVPWKIDALNLDTGPARDLHVDESERNRYSRAAFKHLVEKAVAGVVVAIAVAGEAFFIEEICVQHVDRGFGGACVLQAPARDEAFTGGRAHVVESLKGRGR